MNTTTQQIPVEVPVGYRPIRFCRIPESHPETMYLDATGIPKSWDSKLGSLGAYIILEPDPTYIDTTTEEYRVEVYRQWWNGMTVEFKSPYNGLWYECSGEHLAIRDAVVRVEPEATDELGPYYLDNGEKVYVPR